ncbi:ABC transporter ATP-binding protein [Endozoicomonas sp. OPT23]|uniref:ABC transporter ATP-binding protein n=1 Tax=Endozoicomonas sp. OPT23 TaxID=2072845 RepID=UPI00129ABA1D|nr:ABC transporter ATP-binding protein [Endozoicomonas sp. OPT23]MRI34418.1 ABC transporter ATP-binding protein [Endozoicomonas sp. OPT23]
MSVTPDLECRGINKSFGQFQAVNDVSFSIPAGSFFSILGPSGCGKTSLLRMLAGFSEPDSGEILIKGKSVKGIPPNKRPVNMVFQHLALFPMMNVGDNIAYGLKRRKVSAQEQQRRVADVLERIGLPGIEKKSIDQLSGGQKQRVAIARCLILEPALLLLDEPLGALDLKLREQMKIELKTLQQTFGTTFVYITHDQSEAMVMSDQVAVMNHGRFEQVGSPQTLYYQPETPFVAGFVGNNNRLSGQVIKTAKDFIQVSTESGHIFHTSSSSILETNTAVEMFLRPEAIHIDRDSDKSWQNTMKGRIDNILFDGGNSQLLVRDTASPTQMTVALPQTGKYQKLRQGEIIKLGWNAEQSIAFKAG